MNKKSLERYNNCVEELKRIDTTKAGYIKEFEKLYNKYGVDVVNVTREQLEL